MEINLIHQELLTDVAFAATLPEEIKGKIGSLNQMVEQYNANPSEDAAVKINKISAKLWHAIKDVEESNRPDEDVPVPPVEVVEEEVEDRPISLAERRRRGW